MNQFKNQIAPKIRDFYTRTRERVVARPVFYGVITLVAIFLLWSLFGPEKKPEETLLVVTPATFVKQVSVSGKVVAAESVELGFDQSGRVAGVYAPVGTIVSAGTILASIANGDLRADLLQKQAALAAEEAKLKALEQGTRLEELAVTQSSVASAESALIQAEFAAFNSIKDAYTKTDDAVHAKVDLFISNPKSSNPQVQFTVPDSQLVIKFLAARLKMENALLKWQENISQPFSTGNLMTLVTEAEINLALASTLLDYASAALNMTQVNTSLSQTTLDGYKSSILAGRTNINLAISALASAVTAKKSAEATLLTAKSNLNLDLAGSSALDIAAQASRVKSAEADVLNSEARLRKSYVVAPFLGVVTKMDAKVGEVASLGDSKIGMISTNAFQIESYVPEVEIAHLLVGNTGVVTLDAYGDQVPFEASVVAIDPAETIRDGVSTYKVKLQFKTNDARVKSGMTANITITTATRPDALMVPQGLIIDKGGKKYLLLKNDGKRVEREVTVGAVSSLGQIEILSGIVEGEVAIVPGEVK